MMWDEACLSLLLASEERLGSVLRNNARISRAQEDAAAGAVAAAVGE